MLTDEEKKYKMRFIEEKLKEKECRLTPQRRATLDVLIENQSKHLSTEDIYELVKNKFPDVGLATIYRTLQLFDDFNIIKKLDFNDGCYRYELSEDQRHQHHHLICIKCGNVYEFDDDLLDELEGKIYKSNDFTVLDHMVKFFGYCKNCKETK
ncbi:Ferric uptake regulation protein [Tepidanaerobacter acetatoxydans Re1]|uniref:Ferric uptake regulation protein n=2 Tax=Tepidanaerobacter acetatoxydans TaxID=499229 RepID=F4LVI6_TEPAE|nr:Fur family transcriptional regulator [Tepidanaerobacter acetatoxydans]AEE91572.1 ferric uptake regulator, Fur family [Tepidanaerobacter acetatoxydans Re1]CDI40728.1 Ferric uptake regulation protein [Tepidanaerobacter acetatoxydans Re1]